MEVQTRTRAASAPRLSCDEVRARFSSAMSEMYRQEVPQYGTLLELVADVNRAAGSQQTPATVQGDGRARVEVERHGAIRVGTARELATLRRIFAVMGMHPVGYYDLSAAGVPVHSTAFRPVTREALDANPLRIFTSLLRLDLVRAPLRDTAAEILWSRSIFTEQALRLTRQFEETGGFTSHEADEFVAEVLHTFRWHGRATVGQETYRQLHEAHRLIADIVCFKGPHINHLTPRTLDIDAVQQEMPRRGIVPKDTIEGPPRRRVPILLRQTSFKALEETIRFPDAGGERGAHTARFGEVEQRGMALTRKGRQLYDSLLQSARMDAPAASTPAEHAQRLADAFRSFPDDAGEIRRRGLGFFRYTVARPSDAASAQGLEIDALVDQGFVQATPITYEDFLPVSAAGIFQSNLGDAREGPLAAAGARAEFEAALGAEVQDEFALYEWDQADSIAGVMQWLHAGAQDGR